MMNGTLWPPQPILAVSVGQTPRSLAANFIFAKLIEALAVGH
jgi:hypothetical protein